MPDVIGLFLRSSDNYYQRRLREVAEREAKRHGFELLVQTVKFDASQQVVQIREAIKNASATNLVAILVSGVHDEELSPVAHEAAEAGLDWCLLNDATFIDDVHGQHPERAIFAATCDHTEIGRIHAAQVRALIGNSGHVACITGNVKNIESRLRLDGLKEGLDGQFDLVVLNADWTSEGARMAVERWAGGVTTQESFPAAFVAQNDEMALGVRQALRDIDTRRDWPVGGTPITGCDGVETFGQRLVREGRLKATVIMPPGTGVAIEWIARARRNGSLPPVRVLLPVASFPALARLKH